MNHGFAGRKWIAAGLAVLLALGLGAACAEQSVRLPESPYVLQIPDSLVYDGPGADGLCLFAYVSETLEIDFCLYDWNGQDLREVALQMAEAGEEAEITVVNGIEMLAGRWRDETDGAPCVSYALRTGDRIVEIDFWYADQPAADLTARIMESIHESLD